MCTEATQNKTFAAITHAKKRIQMLLGRKMKSKFCPSLNIRLDEQFKKNLETMNLIDDLAAELKDKDSVDPEHD